jgi:RIO-like serine/threonine protein kinase
MRAEQGSAVLKQDLFGRIERAGPALVRRIVTQRRGVRALARRLLARETRALRALAGVPGVPRLVESERDALVRSYVEGAPLSKTDALPLDFFDHLEALVRAVHARGVCHNDLHKEQNVLVGADGRPWLIDFQLASVHRRPGWLARSRMRDDLRHVAKHRRRYTRDRSVSLGRRSGFAWVWRRVGKPVYVLLTRRVLGKWDGAEERRPSSGPWPRWTEALGPAGDRPCE